jgi:3-dehydroquinate dehydratase/shikimate dehydrogenase
MAFLNLAGGVDVGPGNGEGTRFLTSAHDFDGRPANLISLFSEMSQSRADVVKLAWRARSVRDNVEAFELLRDAVKPSVAICMGQAGLPSRVLAKKFNAYLSFAAPPALNGGPPTAEGQVPVEVMKRRYRWDAIGRATRVYGVVAHPVEHSRSPHVHNAAFDAVGHDGVYLPLPVEPGYESFKAFMETWLRFEPLDLAGLSITLPHKENALRYARETGSRVDDLADRVGSVNTFIVERDDEGEPTLRATNTDLDAILHAAAEALGLKPNDLRGRSVGVLGAGGTGRTAVAAFVDAGCDVTVYNRTRARADELAGAFVPATSAAWGDVANGTHDIWINTTSVGMARGDNEHASPFGETTPASVGPGTLVFDTIYAPPRTRFLEQARDAGAATVNGKPMFLRQAAAQFEQWTNQPAPLDAMADAFEGK